MVKIQREKISLFILLIFSFLWVSSLSSATTTIDESIKLTVHGQQKSDAETTNKNGEWREIDIQFKPNFPTVDIRGFNMLRIRCSAPFLLEVVMNPEIAANLDTIKTLHYVENILKEDSFMHQVDLEILVYCELMGFVQCQKVGNSSIFNRIRQFLRLDLKVENWIQIFNYMGESEGSEQGQFLIPCKTKFPQLKENPPKLYQVTENQRTEVLNGLYKQERGFFIPATNASSGSGVFQGTFQCVYNPQDLDGKEKSGVSEVTEGQIVTFVFVSTDDGQDGDRGVWFDKQFFFLPESLVTGRGPGGNKTVDEDGGQVALNFEGNTLKCRNVEGSVTRQLLLNVPCSSPLHCSIVQNSCYELGNCLYNNQGDPCENSESCLVIKDSDSLDHGHVLCFSGRKNVTKTFFTGLDGVKYWRTRDDINLLSNEALVTLSLDSFDSSLTATEEYFVQCNASSFLFAPQLQFSVLTKDKGMSLLPEGSFRIHSETVSDLQITKEMWVKFTPDITGIVCHAPWHNSSTDYKTASIEFTVHSDLDSGCLKNAASVAAVVSVINLLTIALYN